jgi:hypothetical protein
VHPAYRHADIGPGKVKKTCCKLYIFKSITVLPEINADPKRNDISALEGLKIQYYGPQGVSALGARPNDRMTAIIMIIEVIFWPREVRSQQFESAGTPTDRR